MNLKIIQAGVDREAEREQLSMTQLKGLGYRYIRVENPVCEYDPPLDHVFEGNKHWYLGKTKRLDQWGLTARHYGCWLSQKQSLAIGFSDAGHFLVCEGDVKILDEEKFKLRLEEAIKILDETSYHIITFSEPNRAVTTNLGKQVGENFCEFDEIAGAYCYLVNEKSKDFFDLMFEKIGWHAYDWWLVYGFKQLNQKMLCQKEKIVAWYPGLSEIDVGLSR
jgi:hypothetical protein